jgi:zinc protease
MFELRLRKLADEGKVSFVDPKAAVSAAFPDWELAAVGVNARIADWRAATVELELEHRRAVQFGFTSAELQEARTAFKVRFEQSERSAATRPSPWLAQQLVGTLLNGAVYTTPAAARRDLEADLDAAQLSDCLREFRKVWTDGSPTVFASANAAFEGSRREIAEAFNSSRSTAVTRPPEVAVPAFAYTDFGAPGALVREERLDDLEVRLAEYANGARLNFKATKFEADIVEVRVRVGNGKQSQLITRPGLDTLANVATVAGGLGRHTETELNAILSGHALGLAFEVQSDTCLFAGRCATREMDMLLRVIAAFLSDASFRPDAMRKARPQYGSIIANLVATPAGPISMSALRDIYNGDPRFGVPVYDEFVARDMGEVRAWLDPQFRGGPLEVSVVGDTTWEATQASVARTLGALPRREPVVPGRSGPPVELATNPRTLRIYTLSPKLQQGAVAWFWPAQDVAGIREERRCHLLAAILGERVRVKLREGLGSAYVNGVSFVKSDGFPNANYFSLYAEIDPRRMKQGIEILRREAQDLSTKGPTADEFERAKQPYIRSMNDAVQSNDYWSGTVLDDAQQRPDRIEAARNRATDIASITRSEMVRLARKYLKPELAYEFATVPAPFVSTKK